MAVTIIIHSTHRLAQSVVAHLVLAAVLVIEADIFTELAVADLSVRTLGVAGADLGLLDAGHHGGGVGEVGVHRLATSIAQNATSMSNRMHRPNWISDICIC